MNMAFFFSFFPSHAPALAVRAAAARARVVRCLGMLFLVRKGCPFSAARRERGDDRCGLLGVVTGGVASDVWCDFLLRVESVWL